jgi:hypothetical protein
MMPIYESILHYDVCESVGTHPHPLENMVNKQPLISPQRKEERAPPYRESKNKA